MSIKELLAARQLTRAVIIDDAFDATPLAEDLAADVDAWSVFLADLGEHQREVAGRFPSYKETPISQLMRSDEFVRTLWELKGALPPDLWSPLFGAYSATRDADLTFLGQLEGRLRALGVETMKAGRHASSIPPEVNLVFVDLFLGPTQASTDIDRSIERVIELMFGRERSPPIVILMSRSASLDARKADFRDRAKLLGSLFRVYRKDDLLSGHNLELALERLARHRPDAIRAATFLHCWENSLAAAAERFLRSVRRLDLSDFAQINQVLLTFEGQPIGSYLLDVFDRVLQHEIEGDSETICAAAELNNLHELDYPAPHIAGTPDLQDLVYRMIWQNPHRLSVRSTLADVPVGFGDVVVKRSVLDRTPDPKPDLPDALVVMTPACDLVRKNESLRILLMAGRVQELNHGSWSYKGSNLRTPIMVLPGSNRRVWVQWDVKHILASPLGDLGDLVGPEGSHRVALRLRESNALELQQRLLADLGRVGLVAKMPATFAVSVAAYYLARDNKLSSFGPQHAGVCYTGRTEKGESNVRLVIPEFVIDEILAHIHAIDLDLVSERAHAALGRLRRSSVALASAMQRGLRVPAPEKQSFSQLKVSVSEGDGPSEDAVLGLIARNPATLEIGSGEQRSAALVLVLIDQAHSDAHPMDVDDPDVG